MKRTNVGVWGRDEARAWALFVPHSQTEKEAGFLVWAFDRFSKRDVHSVLDLGCGTGRLAVELASRGYSLTGVDKHAAMVDGAGRAAADRGVKLRLFRTPLEKLSVEGRYDAAYSVYSVFNYLLDEETLLRTLKKLRKLVLPGGVLVLDVSNYAAVYGYFKKAITRKSEGDGWSIEMRTDYDIDDVRMLWHHHETNVMKLGARTRRWKETHTLRMWGFPELKRHLMASGFGAPHLFGEMKAGAGEVSSHAPRLVLVCPRP